LFKSTHNSPSIASTVYSLTLETLHTLRGEETTHMNLRIIIAACLGVPMVFILYYFELT